jgi:hypothetical protein
MKVFPLGSLVTFVFRFFLLNSLNKTANGQTKRTARGAMRKTCDRMRGLVHRPSSVGWIGFTKRRWLRSPPQTHAMVHKMILQNIYNLTDRNYTVFPAFVKERREMCYSNLKSELFKPEK